mmetsp:Transcript_3734/g.17127  ORF Transcript_3734/g.17127 Transcript_3734/m.17127 type:complete len:223 (-) Transcript_3734:1062-1730(-)
MSPPTGARGPRCDDASPHMSAASASGSHHAPSSTLSSSPPSSFHASSALGPASRASAAAAACSFRTTASVRLANDTGSHAPPSGLASPAAAPTSSPGTPSRSRDAAAEALMSSGAVAASAIEEVPSRESLGLYLPEKWSALHLRVSLRHDERLQSLESLRLCIRLRPLRRFLRGPLLLPGPVPDALHPRVGEGFDLTLDHLVETRLHGPSRSLTRRTRCVDR